MQSNGTGGTGNGRAEGQAPAKALCPWLGSDQDPEVRHLEPMQSHVCYARQREPYVELEYQTQYCLTAAHRNCRFYREPPAAARAPQPSRPAEDEEADEVGPLPRRLPLVPLLPWALAAVAAAAVIVFYGVALLRPRAPEATASPAAVAALSPAAVVQASEGPTASVTPTPTRPAAAGTEASPTFAFVEATATSTPYPGGAIYALAPAAGAVGWVASNESRGNHLGDSYLYAGFFDGIVYHGVMQFDLSAVPRGATIYDGVLEIAGLDDTRLGEAGVWEVRVLGREADADWSRTAYQAVHNAAVSWTLPPPLAAGDLAAGRTYAFTLAPEQRLDLEQRLADEHYTVSLRIDGPLAGEESVFAWDTGYGPASQGRKPRLVLNVGAPPKTPLPSGTPEWVVVTSTPTPANVVTVAAIAARQTAAVATAGLPTPTSAYQATPTPEYLFVTNTPTPASSATAEYQVALATALAFLTGTPTAAPQNLATLEPVVLPWQPTPANAVTAAAIAARRTAEATTTGTATPLPAYYVTATPRYIVVTQTPTPGNRATAVYQRALATANVILTGTATPAPPNLATATYTPLPTNTPPLYWLDEVTPWSISPTPSRTPAPPIPKPLRGKILFLSDRQSAAGEDPKVFALDPATGRVALVTGTWPHALASIRDRYSPDGKYMVGVRDWTVDVENIVDEAVTVDQMAGYQVYVIQLSDGFTWGLTFSRTSYDPAWSPRGDLIAFVSQEEEGKQPDHNASGGDEIYVITPQGKEKRRLTFNTWEWDKHPTFSPDGSKIVYYSNQETGRKQLWIVNTDGSGRRVLLHSPYNDWDPVWVK